VARRGSVARLVVLWVALVALALIVSACGEDNQPSAVEWRNVTVRLPDDWYVFEEAETRLSISNQDIGPDVARDEQPDGDEPVVAMFFTYEPNTLPDDWRAYVDQQDGTLEVDDRFVLDGEVPATRLVFSYVTDDVPLREMVVVIPSRGIVVLSQPVPAPGDTSGPDVFLDYVETFVEVLEEASFGAPLLD
jgi:hypothetical protein